MVLASHGGALQRILPPFRLGLGGPVGGGQQWMSWITLNDLTEIFMHCMNNRRMTGVINAVSPNPVQNREFAVALGAALGKPAITPLPAFAVKLALGEMGKELVLASTRVKPERLEQSGFEWKHPEIGEALKACIDGAI
jgi:uncharacterized protein (TIGR01777 family)